MSLTDLHKIPQMGRHIEPPQTINPTRQRMIDRAQVREICRRWAEWEGTKKDFAQIERHKVRNRAGELVACSGQTIINIINGDYASYYNKQARLR